MIDKKNIVQTTRKIANIYFNRRSYTKI